MRIFVFGNINSGKSTLIDLVKKKYKNYNDLRIDNFRRKYGKGDIESDNYAQEMFVQSIKEHKNAIVEATGLGPLGHKLERSFHDLFGIIIYIDTPVSVCLDRIQPGKFNDTPYPEFSESLENTIKRCGAEFEQDDLVSLWGKKITQQFKINGNQSFSEQLVELPLEILSYFEELVAVLKKSGKIQSLFLFGSMSKGEMTRSSDIDLFTVTNLTANEIEMILNSKLDPKPLFSDSIRNKLTLRYKGNLLIEIHCIKTIEEAEIFYRESKIKDVKQTIYISDATLIKTLEDFNNYNLNEKLLVEELISKIFYFIYSLPGIKQKGDKYKYYFHGNIILHNFVRLKALLSGVTDKNYLPENSMQYFSEEEFNSLLPSFETDPDLYLKALISFFQEVLYEAQKTYDVDIKKYLNFITELTV
jgi:predicted nucleotidyltransferase